MDGEVQVLQVVNLGAEPEVGIAEPVDNEVVVNAGDQDPLSDVKFSVVELS